MKKIILLSTILAVLAIAGFCVFASSGQVKPKLTSINIIGPNAVPENTQNVFHVAAIYDNGSIVEVTPDASITVNPDKHAVINLGGIIETFKQNQQQQFTIYAKYQGLAAEKLVIVYPLCDKHLSGAEK
jgi:hypothetical protein